MRVYEVMDALRKAMRCYGGVMVCGDGVMRCYGGVMKCFPRNLAILLDRYTISNAITESNIILNKLLLIALVVMWQIPTICRAIPHRAMKSMKYPSTNKLNSFSKISSHVGENDLLFSAVGFGIR